MATLGTKSLNLHKYFVGIIWGAGNEKQGRYLRRAQVAPGETKVPSLGENNFIHQWYHESFCVNHWERASFQYSQWESSTGWNGRLLTNVWTISFSARDCFIKDCNDDPNVYQNPIKRQKTKNFASEAGSYKVSSKNKSPVAVSMTRYLFGSILYHALQAWGWHGVNT